VTGLSYAKGPTDVALLDVTIGSALRQAASRWADGLALVSRHQGLRWTWAELDAAVDRVASGLRRLGVMPGDRVGIWAPNCAEWTLIQFATARIGAVLVTINPAYRVSEVAYALNKVGCSVLVTAVRFKTSDYLAMLREIGPARLPQLRATITIGEEAHEGFLPWSALDVAADPAALATAEAAHAPDDAINIQFTSGTTGFPKGATLTPQYPEQRLFHRADHRAHAGGPHLHPGAALPLFRHGARQSRRARERRGHGLSRRGV
jgi:fatty-acyl-CoA synthase